MKVLVVEDDLALGSQLKDRLTVEGYTVDVARTGDHADYLGETESLDAIVLDLGLPDCDGMSLLQDWRGRGWPTPVVILTARDHWSDKVHAIDAGADDYLTKPFQMEELTARLRAVIRRTHGFSRAVLRCRGLLLDTSAGRLLIGGKPVTLTPFEYRVLSYLLHNQGRVISRAELSEHVYPAESDRDSNTIEVFIGRLRRKVGEGIIRTLRGQGYLIEPDDRLTDA